MRDGQTEVRRRGD